MLTDPDDSFSADLSIRNQSLRVWKRNSGWSFTERDFTSNEKSIG